MNTEKILIIEDEELIREELKTLLSNAGYVVDCVVDFGETLNYIKLTSPDLILLDVNLPGQDGYRLCTSIRSFAAIPILFITGRNTAMDELQALANSPGRVFSKEQIYDIVWKEAYSGDYNIVMSHIRNIREKIEDNPSKPVYIQTVWGVGYRFNKNLSSGL